MFNTKSRLLVILFASLLFAVPFQAHAQEGDYEPEEYPPNSAFIFLHVDQDGSVNVSFEVPVAAGQHNQLQQAFANSFSFPLQVKESVTETPSTQPWTTISATSPKAFSGSGMKTSCVIDLHALITQLQAHHIELMNSRKRSC